jgi:Domain of unknown function (DUF4145)
MKCPHCSIHFHDNWVEGSVERGTYYPPAGVPYPPDGLPIETGWRYRTAVCPKCSKLTIELSPPPERRPVFEEGELLKKGEVLQEGEVLKERQWRQVQPVGSNRGAVPPEVPEPIAADYVEACQVLPLSAKASAALARRCLQAMLHIHGYRDKDLAKEVQQLLAETDPNKALPGPIRQTVDAIRHFGNFSAHPVNDKTSVQVIDVEPEEAEWCLEILEALFEHFYVGPAAAAAKKAALDAKLKAAGKTPSK